MPFVARRQIAERQAQRRDVPRHETSEAGGRWFASFALGGALALSAAAWWLARPGPVERLVSQAPMKMHVAEIVSTDATFHEPARAFGGSAAYWRVSIRDAQNHPVAAARVRVDVVAPDGDVRARPVTITGNDGLALFTYVLRDSELPGVYAVRVVSVSHLNRRGASYDPASNAAWANSFSVTNR